MQKRIHTSEILIEAIEFERLCADIFKSKGFLVEREFVVNKNNKYYEIDIILKNENKIIAVEVKYYRTRKPSKSMLEQAIKKIKLFTEDLNIERQMLIVGMPIDNKIKTDLSINYDIEILDSNNLLFLINDNEELLHKFRVLMSDITSEAQGTEKAEEIDLNYLFSNNTTKSIPAEKAILDSTAEKLWSELERIVPGQNSFTEYENKCAEILKYLFSENLNGWNEQLRTDDDLNRYDLICRVKRGNEFWGFLIDEFHSRYIVFEFKNYTDKVKQTQVYTTEKYLFQKALRNVCFMISHNGLDDNALTATKGILRETGKLIIDIKDEDIYKMLKLKEFGDEPSDYLFEIVDKTLLILSK